MTKASSIAALIGIWTAGTLAAAAAYAVHRPLVVPPAAELRVSLAEAQPSLPEDPTMTEQEEIMILPADTIVATVPRVVPAPVRAELRCQGWVDLSQGPVGARVRYCE